MLSNPLVFDRRLGTAIVSPPPTAQARLHTPQPAKSNRIQETQPGILETDADIVAGAVSSTGSCTDRTAEAGEFDGKFAIGLSIWGGRQGIPLRGQHFFYERGVPVTIILSICIYMEGSRMSSTTGINKTWEKLGVIRQRRSTRRRRNRRRESDSMQTVCRVSSR